MRIIDITVKIYNKLFEIVHSVNSYRVKLPDHLCMSFLDQTQSDFVVFSNISSDIYEYLVTKWKHIISIHEIVAFNKSLENLTITTLELTNIYESSHEDGVVIFITCSKLEINEENDAIKYEEGKHHSVILYI